MAAISRLHRTDAAGKGGPHGGPHPSHPPDDFRPEEDDMDIGFWVFQTLNALQLSMLLFLL